MLARQSQLNAGMKDSCFQLSITRGSPTPVSARIKQVSYCVKPSVEVLEHHSGGVGTWLAQLKKQTTEKSGPTKSMSALYLLPHFGAITSLGNRNILIFWLRKWRFGRAAYSTQRRDSGRFIGGLGDSRVPSKIESPQSHSFQCTSDNQTSP